MFSGSDAGIGEHDLGVSIDGVGIAAGDPRAEAADVELVRRDAAEALVVVHADEPLELGVEARLLVKLAQRVRRRRRSDLGVAAGQRPASVVGALDERDAARVVERGDGAADLRTRDADVREVRTLRREVRVDGHAGHLLGDRPSSVRSGRGRSRSSRTPARCAPSPRARGPRNASARTDAWASHTTQTCRRSRGRSSTP